MNISYDYYRVFYYVARYKSITLAAEVLLSNQPNVTRTIKNLETELGCMLFVRSRKGVKLTPEGKKLYEHIRIAFEHIEAGEEELALEQTLQRGVLSIGVSEIALHGFLLPILKEYRQLYPGIRIKVSNYSTPQALAALRSGLVDLAFVTTPLDISKSLICKTLKSFRDEVICGNTYKFLIDKELSFEKLSDYPLISLGEKTKSFDFYSKLFTENGVVFKPSVEAATANQIIPLVLHDLGIGFVPDFFLNGPMIDEDIYCLSLKSKIPSREICMVKRKDFSLSTAARKLEEMVTSCLK